MAENIDTKRIEFPSNGHTTPGYLAFPSGGKGPGVIVLQEWWGLVPHIKDVCERLAREGFVALAVDLYHGQEASEPDEARKLAMELDRAKAAVEISAAVKYLQRLEEVSPKKVGLIGYCMGGGLAVETATQDEEIDAVVVFYGNPGDLNRVRSIKAPVLGLYGENDAGIPPEVATAFENALEKHAIPHQVHIYPGAGHAFFNDNRPGSYHPQAAEDAWQRTLDWFRRYLK
jgi:carboxymethylenebutenolidase